MYPTPKSTTISRHLRSSPSIEFPETLSGTITGLATPSTAPRPKPKPKPVPVLQAKVKVKFTSRPKAKLLGIGRSSVLPAPAVAHDSGDDMDVIELFSSDSESEVGRRTSRTMSGVHGDQYRNRNESHVRESSLLTPVPASRSESDDMQRPAEAPTTPEPVASPTTSTTDSYIITPTQLRFVPSSQPTQDYGGKHREHHDVESETESESDEENPFAARRGDKHRGGGGGVGSGSTSLPKAYQLPEFSTPSHSSSLRATSVLTPAPQPRQRRPSTLLYGPATVASSSTSPYKVPALPILPDRIWNLSNRHKKEDEDLEVVPSSQSQSQTHYLSSPQNHNTSCNRIGTTTESDSSGQHPIDWYEVVPSSQSQEVEMQLPQGWYELQDQAATSPSSRPSPQVLLEPTDDPMDVHISSPDSAPIRPPSMNSSSLVQSSSQSSHSSFDIPPHHSTPPPPDLKPMSQISSAPHGRSLTSSAERKLRIRDINLHHADLSRPISHSLRSAGRDRGLRQEDSETEEESDDEEGQYHVYPAPPERTPSPPSPPRAQSPFAAIASSSTSRVVDSGLQTNLADPAHSKHVENMPEVGPSEVLARPHTPTSPSANDDTSDVHQHMLRKVYRGLVRYTAKARVQSQYTQSASQFTQFQANNESKPEFDLKAEMKKLGLDLDNDLDMKFDSQQTNEGGFSVPEDMKMLDLSDDDDEGVGLDGNWDMDELPSAVKEVIKRAEAASQST